MKRVLYVLRNIDFSRNSTPLGRWCHESYKNYCDSGIKNFLANIDNSSENTGLCKKKELKSYQKDTRLKKQSNRL